MGVVMTISKGRGLKLHGERNRVIITIRHGNAIDKEFIQELEKYSDDLDLSYSDTIKQLVLFAVSAKKAGAIIENGVLLKKEVL
jgi:hypothetical protein